MMLSPELGIDGLARLERILSDIKRLPELKRPPLPSPRPKRILSPREAIFSPSEEIPTEECIGHIQAATTVACPPAIPLVICGEEIDRDTVELLNYYGIKKCRVVK
jgi:arginine/lysine/ornithine decarboxylase